MDSIHELLQHELKDLYSAENQLLKAMPKMAKKLTTQSLKDAMALHLEQTKGQVERLTKMGEILGMKKMTGTKCLAMEGLIKEAQEIIAEEEPSEATDVAIVGSAQRIEHYEIAGYGICRTLAKALKLKDVADLIAETLKEEGDTDKILTKLCEKEIIPAAIAAGHEDEAVDEDDDEASEEPGEDDDE